MQKIRLYSSKAFFALFAALSVALCIFIFCMSNEPAPVSADRSGSIADVIAPIFIKDFDSASESDKLLILSEIDHIIRKIAHFCMYATLGALFVLTSLFYELKWTFHFVVPWIFGTLYAASDEIHQAFVPGRGPLVSDVLLDSVGVLFGILIILAFTRFLTVMRKVDNNE